MANLMDEINAAIKRNCTHVCHERGLNPWVKSCPTCGCENPKYDPEAVSDIDFVEPDFNQALGILCGLGRQTK